MIQSIEKKVLEDKLEVKVVCNIRKYSKNPIKLLTTTDLLDILNKEYKIAETLEEPSYKVGNLNVKKVSNVGKWIFRLEKKPNTRLPKKKTIEVPQKEKPGKSIRNRISAIANK
jgi:hypothetical protein